MATKAYVLIKAAVDKLNEVADALCVTPGVSSVDPVSGPYDIIVLVEGMDMNAVGRVISFGIKPISGVTRTLTCLFV